MENLSGFQLLDLPESDVPTPFNPKERVCKIFNCGTKLTRFNLGEYCHLHKPLAILAKRDDFISRTNANKRTRKD